MAIADIFEDAEQRLGSGQAVAATFGCGFGRFGQGRFGAARR